jgi:AraC-like DNA-binding protein
MSATPPSHELRLAVQRHAQAHADANGHAPTALAGLSTVCAHTPSDLVHAISRPLACLVVQGRKAVSLGASTLSFSAGESLLIAADVPTVSQIIEASAAQPYLSLVLELDPALIADLSAQMGTPQTERGAPVRVTSTDAEVADAALRLMRLLERPDAVPVLGPQMLRELHYWLMVGRHGAAIRQLGWPGGHTERVARAVALLRADFARPLRVDTLAGAAGMSASAFHQHFRAVTSLSPLQFQKQLRLIEARRLMLADGVSSSSAAFAVGYQSVPQFTREYGRLFGQPPVRETRTARGVPQAPAGAAAPPVTPA